MRKSFFLGKEAKKGFPINLQIREELFLKNEFHFILYHEFYDGC